MGTLNFEFNFAGMRFFEINILIAIVAVLLLIIYLAYAIQLRKKEDKPLSELPVMAMIYGSLILFAGGLAGISILYSANLLYSDQNVIIHFREFLDKFSVIYLFSDIIISVLVMILLLARQKRKYNLNEIPLIDVSGQKI